MHSLTGVICSVAIGGAARPDIPCGTYTWGHWLLSKLETGNSQLSYYGYDGHGSVRFLTDVAGAVTDTYDYDGFGNLIGSTGSTPNNYLFAGEQYDATLGLYYNRARYLDVRTGRFWGMDAHEGNNPDPRSLHKYVYVESDPTNKIDRSGHESLAEVAVVTAVIATLALNTITLLTFLNNTAAANESIDGFILSARFDVQALGGLGGAGVDFVWDFHTSSLWAAGTLEAGISPLAVYKPTSKTAWSLTAGPVFGMNSPSQLSGGSTQMVLPLSVIHLFPNLFTGGMPKVQGMMRQLAKNSKANNTRWSHWVLALGVSTSGPSSMQFGPRQNFFAEIVGNTADFHKVLQLNAPFDALSPVVDAIKGFGTTGDFAAGFDQFLTALSSVGGQ